MSRWAKEGLGAMNDKLFANLVSAMHFANQPIMHTFRFVKKVVPNHDRGSAHCINGPMQFSPEALPQLIDGKASAIAG